MSRSKWIKHPTEKNDFHFVLSFSKVKKRKKLRNTKISIKNKIKVLCSENLFLKNEQERFSHEFIGILSYFIVWLVAGRTDRKKSGKGEEDLKK